MGISVHQDAHSESSASVNKSIPQKNEMSETRAEHAGVLAPEYAEAEEQQLWWSGMRANMRDFWSEFFGTMVLILFGDGVVAQVVLSGGEKGEYQSISWGWG
jgi:aquaglyceroporin related protein